MRPPPPLPANVEAALARGSKIEAIKLLRDATGIGLAEAKHLVEARERAEYGEDDEDEDDEDDEEDVESASPPPAGLAAVTSALHAGQKVEAIRLYRALTGVGLKEAKDAVDAMDPHFSGSRAPHGGLSPGEVPRTAGWWGWVLAAAALGTVAAWYLG